MIWTLCVASKPIAFPFSNFLPWHRRCLSIIQSCVRSHLQSFDSCSDNLFVTMCGLRSPFELSLMTDSISGPCESFCKHSQCRGEGTTSTSSSFRIGCLSWMRRAGQRGIVASLLPSFILVARKCDGGGLELPVQRDNQS